MGLGRFWFVRLFRSRTIAELLRGTVAKNVVYFELDFSTAEATATLPIIPSFLSRVLTEGVGPEEAFAALKKKSSNQFGITTGGFFDAPPAKVCAPCMPANRTHPAHVLPRCLCPSCTWPHERRGVCSCQHNNHTKRFGLAQKPNTSTESHGHVVIYLNPSADCRRRRTGEAGPGHVKI